MSILNEEKTIPGRFVKGNPGGPGRPKGSRQKLADSFLKALAEDFKTHGKAALESLRTKDAAAYLNMIAGLLPKDVNVRSDQTLTIRSEPVSETAGWLEGATAGDSAGKVEKLGEDRPLLLDQVRSETRGH